MTSQSTQDMPLILFAMKDEAVPFFKAARAAGWHVRRTRGQTVLGKDGSYWQASVSGPGPDNVQRLLSAVQPRCVINPGFAGSLSTSLQPGDVTRVTTVRCGVEVAEIAPGLLDCTGIEPARIVTAPVPLGAADKSVMHGHDAGDLVDMETWYIHRWCVENDVAYTGIRVVSDSLDDELPDAVKDSYDGHRFRLGHIIRAALFNRRARAELLQLRDQSRRAAGALARVLLEAMDRTGPIRL